VSLGLGGEELRGKQEIETQIKEKQGRNTQHHKRNTTQQQKHTEKGVLTTGRSLSLYIYIYMWNIAGIYKEYPYIFII